MELYALAKIAKILKIPESTARHYRDRHLGYFYQPEEVFEDHIKEVIKAKNEY